MKEIEKKYALFAAAGGASGILLQPFVSGLFRISEAFYVIAPGLIFASSVTIAAVSLRDSDAPKSGLRKRFALGALTLAAGMPLAFLAGVASINIMERFVPGDRFDLGGIGIPFFFGEIVSCVVWSSVLFAWTILTNRAKARHIMRVALLVTISIMLSVNLVEVISKTLWRKSFMFPAISITEEIGSALVLAIGCVGYSVHRGRSVDQG